MGKDRATTSFIKTMMYIMAIYFCKSHRELIPSLMQFGMKYFEDGQYQIGLRVLIKGLQMKYDDFDQELRREALKQVKKYHQNVWNMKTCSNCGKNKKLNSCKGCLKVFYCSKRCQKNDWNNKHRVECDRE